MRRSFTVFFAIATSVTVGCSSTGRVPTVVPSAPLSLDVTITFPQGTPGYGDLGAARVVVTNGTLSPIILRAVDLPGQLPGRRTWLGARSGRLRYEGARKRFAWQAWQRDETQECFASGYLLPGETVAMDRPVRVRGPIQDVVLLYQVATWGVFLPSRSELTPELAQPRQVYFRDSSPSRSSAYRRLLPGSDERVVLFMAAGELPVVRRQIGVSIAWAEEDMPARVIEDLDRGAGELSAWDAGAAWLLRRPDSAEMIVVSDDGDEESFPALDFEVFDLSDLGVKEGFELLVELPGAEELEQVDPTDLLEFLRGVRNQGARLRVVSVDGDDMERDLILEMR